MENIGFSWPNLKLADKMVLNFQVLYIGLNDASCKYYREECDLVGRIMHVRDDILIFCNRMLILFVLFTGHQRVFH